MARLVIVSNRVAMPTERGPRAGGLAVALKDALPNGSLWFGWSGRIVRSGSRRTDLAQVEGIDYATIDLEQDEYDRFYVGFSNGALWPLLHMRLGLMEFRRDEYFGYRQVNALFARALAKLLRPDDLVWVHDYHLIPMATMLRQQGFRGPIGFFLHVPFVPAEVLSALPRSEELMADLITYDVVGFHARSYKENFLESARKLTDSKISGSDAISPGHRCRCVVTPIGIDARLFRSEAMRSAKGREARRLVDSLAGRALIIGVDRLDYSKGLANRFQGFGKLLEHYPEHRLKVSYLQIAARSREDVQEYNVLRRELDRIVGDLNGQYAEFDWVPLRYMTRALSRQTLSGFYRLARVGLVTPLRDGMNLVAMEYIASQEPMDPGVLVLSKFAGVASYLPEALLVNPHDSDEVADALHEALSMTLEERRTRFERLSAAVFGLSPERFHRDFLKELTAVALAA